MHNCWAVPPFPVPWADKGTGSHWSVVMAVFSPSDLTQAWAHSGWIPNPGAARGGCSLSWAVWQHCMRVGVGGRGTLPGTCGRCVPWWRMHELGCPLGKPASQSKSKWSVSVMTFQVLQTGFLHRRWKEREDALQFLLGPETPAHKYKNGSLNSPLWTKRHLSTWHPKVFVSDVPTREHICFHRFLQLLLDWAFVTQHPNAWGQLVRKCTKLQQSTKAQTI